MNEASELLHQLGSFEPVEARKLLPALETNGISFEVDSDHSALLQPNRALQLYFGLYPEGSKLAVFVREADLSRAQAVLETLFPV